MLILVYVIQYIIMHTGYILVWEILYKYILGNVFLKLSPIFCHYYILKFISVFFY